MIKNSSTESQDGVNHDSKAILRSAADKLRGLIDAAEYKHAVPRADFLEANPAFYAS